MGGVWCSMKGVLTSPEGSSHAGIQTSGHCGGGRCVDCVYRHCSRRGRASWFRAPASLGIGTWARGRRRRSRNATSCHCLRRHRGECAGRARASQLCATQLCATAPDLLRAPAADLLRTATGLLFGAAGVLWGPAGVLCTASAGVLLGSAHLLCSACLLRAAPGQLRGVWWISHGWLRLRAALGNEVGGGA